MKSGGRGSNSGGGGDGGGGGRAVCASLALAEDAALLPRVEALTVFFQALGLATLAPPAHLRQLKAKIENGRDLLDVLGEGARVTGEGLEDCLLVGLVLVHVAAADAVAVGGAEDLQVEALAVHLEALRLAAVAPRLLHLPDLRQPLPLLRAAPHLAPPPPAPRPALLRPQRLPAQPQRRWRGAVGGEGGDRGVAGGQLAAGAGGVEHLLREGAARERHEEVLVGLLLHALLLLEDLLLHRPVTALAVLLRAVVGVVHPRQVVFNNGGALELLEDLLLKEVALGREGERGERQQVLGVAGRVVLHDLPLVQQVPQLRSAVHSRNYYTQQSRETNLRPPPALEELNLTPPANPAALPEPLPLRLRWVIQQLMRVVCPTHILLFLGGLVVRASGLSGYDEAHAVNCNLIDDDWTLQQNLSYLWNIVELRDIDRFAFLVGSPLIAVLQAVLIFTLCKYRLYRSSPLDIVLLCFISEMILNLSFLANAIYYSVFSTAAPMPASFPPFCMATAVLNTFFTILEMLYLVWFLVYAVLSVNKSIKKKQWFESNLKHVVPVGITMVSSALIGVFDWYGLTQFGFCSISSTRNSEKQIYFPVVEVSFSAAFVCFAFFAYRYYRKHMPEGPALNRRKFEENTVMSRFVIGMSIILLLFATATLVLYLNCLSPRPLMLLWATVFNLSRLGEFLYLIGVMLAYKKIGKKVKKVFRGLFSEADAKSSLAMQEKRLDERELIDFIDIGMKEKILDIQEEENQIDFIRITQVITILTGIKIAYQEHLCPAYAHPHQELKSLYFREQVSFEIGPKLIKDYEQAAQILPRISLLRGKFTVMAPRVFERLLSKDEVGEVWRSFGLLENRDQLYRIVESDGGKSGEFFFFTSDCRFILKTLAKDEFLFLLGELEDFYRHFQAHPQTLIAKPYGMFTIENREVDQSYYILLMKNTAGCGRERIIRMYDMKGSTDNRMTLKNNEEGTQAAGRVLKDMDFRRLESQLDVDPSFAKELRMQLRIDTEFLRGLNLIDYSLLVVRVAGDLTAPVSFWGRLGRARSTVSPEEHYHIALIDYLQKWDLGKKSEKWWKNLFGKHDVSALQPSDYQLRFMRFIKEITTCDSYRGTREALSRPPTFEPETLFVEALQKRLGHSKAEVTLGKIGEFLEVQ